MIENTKILTLNIVYANMLGENKILTKRDSSKSLSFLVEINFHNKKMIRNLLMIRLCLFKLLSKKKLEDNVKIYPRY